MSNKPEHSIFDSAKIPCEEISDPSALVKEPLVSAKMITYNHAPYIAQAIEGVLQQEVDFPYELVIGEDCSTDGTREIVFDYQKKYPDIIRVITSDKNVGARKNGLRTGKPCRGKYIAYCEGDDYWHHPLKLQKQVDFLECNTDYGVVYSDVIHYDVSRKKERPTGEVGVLDDERAYEEIITGKRCLWTATVCVRSTILRKALELHSAELYNPQWPMGDTQLWLELARLSRVKYIDEKLATKNMLPESASCFKSTSKRLDFQRRANEMRFHYLKKYPISEEQTLKVLSRRFGYTMYLAYCDRRWDLVRDDYAHLRKRGCDLRWIHYLYYYSSFGLLIYLMLYPVIFSYRLWNKIRRFLVELKTLSYHGKY